MSKGPVAGGSFLLRRREQLGVKWLRIRQGQITLAMRHIRECSLYSKSNMKPLKESVEWGKEGAYTVIRFQLGNSAHSMVSVWCGDWNQCREHQWEGTCKNFNQRWQLLGPEWQPQWWQQQKEAGKCNRYKGNKCKGTKGKSSKDLVMDKRDKEEAGIKNGFSGFWLIHLAGWWSPALRQAPWMRTSLPGEDYEAVLNMLGLSAFEASERDDRNIPG